jgi:hypothetical protein
MLPERRGRWVQVADPVADQDDEPRTASSVYLGRTIPRLHPIRKELA